MKTLTKSTRKGPAPKPTMVAAQPTTDANEPPPTSAVANSFTLTTEVVGEWSVSFPGLGSGKHNINGALTIARVAGIVFAGLTYTSISINVQDAFELVSVDPTRREATVRLKYNVPTMPLGSRFQCIATGNFPLEGRSDSFLPSRFFERERRRY